MYRVIKIWRRHLSYFNTSNCEAYFRAGCQPLFVVAGCLLLNYSSLSKKGTHNPCLPVIFAQTLMPHFLPWIQAPYLNYFMI